MEKYISKFNIPDWLRWVLVIPAAIGAYFGIQIAVALGNSFSPGPEIFINIFCQIVNSVAGPYCLVWAGAKTAPSNRFVVAIILTVIHAIVNGVVVTLGIISNRFSVGYIVWIIFVCLLGIAATIVCCLQFKDDEILENNDTNEMEF